MIINLLGASKFWHLAKIFRIPKWVISEYNKLVWPFLWGSKIETVSRNNCYNSINNGGLNVIDFSLKGQALQAASIVSSVDPAVGKSFYLTRYYVGRRLAVINSRWSHLHSNATPNAKQPTDFYTNAMKTLRQIISKLRDTTTFVFSSRNSYQELLKERCTPISLTLHWPEVSSSNFSSKLFWARTRDKITENVKNDLIWLIVLRGIKVREHMHRWGYIRSAKCAICQRTESMTHCFLTCPRVKEVWAHYNQLISNVLNYQFIPSINSVFFSAF